MRRKPEPLTWKQGSATTKHHAFLEGTSKPLCGVGEPKTGWHDADARNAACWKCLHSTQFYE